MFKRTSQPSKGRQVVFMSLGITAMLAGAAVSTLDMLGVIDFKQLHQEYLAPITELRIGGQSNSLTLRKPSDSFVKTLALMSPDLRSQQLQAIAKRKESPEQARARYLLATDLIKQGKAGSAIQWLNGLDRDYKVLQPYVILQEAQAYEAMGQPEKAKQAWQKLLEEYDEHPVAAEALYALGKTGDRSYWDRALAEFPASPRTVQIAQVLLKEREDKLPLMQVLARHGVYLPGITTVLDQMVETYGDQLTPEEWEAIGFGYWENLTYLKAGEAYSLAPETPINLYRAARGLQLGQRRDDAIAKYYQLSEAFPDAPETAEGLLKLSALVERETAIALLDQIIERFPDSAAEALYEKSLLLDEMDSADSASQARQSILSQYSTSEAAATLRWKMADQHAEQGQYLQAWQWAAQIPNENPDSDLAPEAAFWAGKWALEVNQPDEAQRAFEYTITHYPETYFAWRAAVHLGWDVGDFGTLRYLNPSIQKPMQRAVLPAGSDTLQELYQLGQDRDAWALWQSEFKNPMEPTVAEQFTDGLMRLGVGDNLDGIFMVSSLEWREKPEEIEQYETLAAQDAYWQALYPFPFQDLIQTWSAEHNLNPMLVTALIRQESRFEPQIESVVGAKGLMQVMPDTADWIDQNIGAGDYNLGNPADNIKLGTWYLSYTHQEYGDNSLYAVASYNAGPGNVADWITRDNFKNADEFAHQIPFPETKNYVRAVFGGYWNYLRLYNPDVAAKVEQYTARRASSRTKLDVPSN